MKKKPHPPESTALPKDTRTTSLHQEIATQAYTLWQHYGQPEGRDVSIWLEAERQVLGVDERVNQQSSGASDSPSLASALMADDGRTEADPAPARLHR